MKKEKMKVCKIIVTALIPRKRGGHNVWPSHDANYEVEDVISMVKFAIELDKQYAPGVDMDTIIVNNDVGNEKANNTLKEFQDEKIFIFNRPNNGGSFAAYIDVFLKYKDKYDYFLFTEDDILIGGTENYYVDIINKLNNSSEVGFVALVGVGYEIGKHAHGGVGVVSTSILEKVYESNPFIYEGFDRQRSIGHEIKFTNNIVSKTGLDIIQFGNSGWNLKENYCINYSNYKNI